MLHAGGQQVNSGGFHAGMPQNVRQFHNILVNSVVNRGKQVPQIVGEYFGRVYTRRLANTLHLRPDLTAVHGLSASGEKDLAGGDFLLSGVFQQLFTQLSRQQNRANFTLQRDSGAASPDSLHRDVPHFTHSDARGADGLHDEGNSLPT